MGWVSRWSVMARLVAMGYNVMMLDTDVVLTEHLYPCALTLTLTLTPTRTLPKPSPRVCVWPLCCARGVAEVQLHRLHRHQSSPSSISSSTSTNPNQP